jgi:hypothetical protein
MSIAIKKSQPTKEKTYRSISMQNYVSNPIHQGAHPRTNASDRIVYIAEIDPSPGW